MSFRPTEDLAFANVHARQQLDRIRTDYRALCICLWLLGQTQREIADVLRVSRQAVQLVIATEIERLEGENVQPLQESQLRHLESGQRGGG